MLAINYGYKFSQAINHPWQHLAVALAFTDNFPFIQYFPK